MGKHRVFAYKTNQFVTRLGLNQSEKTTSANYNSLLWLLFNQKKIYCEKKVLSCGAAIIKLHSEKDAGLSKLFFNKKSVRIISSQNNVLLIKQQKPTSSRVAVQNTKFKSIFIQQKHQP